MKNLWTPWRIEHVTGNSPKYDGCLFEPAGNCHTSKAKLLLYRDRYSVVLLNRFPYANGHLLVAPVRHLSCITELTTAENCALMEMVKEATAILKKQFNNVLYCTAPIVNCKTCEHHTTLMYCTQYK